MLPASAQLRNQRTQHDFEIIMESNSKQNRTLLTSLAELIRETESV